MEAGAATDQEFHRYHQRRARRRVSQAGSAVSRGSHKWKMISHIFKGANSFCRAQYFAVKHKVDASDSLHILMR